MTGKTATPPPESSLCLPIFITAINQTLRVGWFILHINPRAPRPFPSQCLCQGWLCWLLGRGGRRFSAFQSRALPPSPSASAAHAETPQATAKSNACCPACNQTPWDPHDFFQKWGQEGKLLSRAIARPGPPAAMLGNRRNAGVRLECRGLAKRQGTGWWDGVGGGDAVAGRTRAGAGREALPQPLCQEPQEQGRGKC